MGNSTRVFKVRNYECDVYGHLYNTNYLRYISELNHELMKAVSIAEDGSTSSMLGWQPCQVYIDFNRPLRLGDRVEVNGCLENLSSRQALWAYEVSSTADTVNAQAKVVYRMHSQDRKFDTEIPHDLLKVLNTYPNRESGTKNIDMPTPTIPPAGAFKQSWTVNWRDIRQDGYLHLAAYFDYLLDFVMGALAELGWSFDREAEAGFAWYVRRHWLEIFTPIQLTDKLCLTSWLSAMKRSTVLRNYTIHNENSGTLLGRAYTLWVCVDPATGRPLRIPERIIQDLTGQIAD